MTFLVLIPIMMLALVCAAVPLLVLTAREHRLRQETDRVGLEWRAISRFGQSYAETLAQWGANFQNAWEEIKVLGFDERFRRLWYFYLSYCEAGFRSERTNVIQLSLAKG